MKIHGNAAFKEEYIEQAREMCRLFGALDHELAVFFKVAERTIRKWRSRYPEFHEACAVAKEEADHLVERRLWERATGYSHPEDKFFVINGKIEKVTTTKHYPPDTGAAAFWMKCRAGWREGGVPDDPNKFEELPPEERIRRLTFVLEKLKREQEAVATAPSLPEPSAAENVERN